MTGRTLIHRSPVPLTLDGLEDRTAENSEREPTTQPVGLWVTDETDDPTLFDSEVRRLGLRGGHAYGYEVKFAQSARLAVLDSVDRLAEFTAIYGVAREYDALTSKGTYRRLTSAIRWADVARDFDGILLSPYRPNAISPDADLSWSWVNWGWSSGVIWRKAAIAALEPVVPKVDIGGDPDRTAERAELRKSGQRLAYRLTAASSADEMAKLISAAIEAAPSPNALGLMATIALSTLAIDVLMPTISAAEAGGAQVRRIFAKLAEDLT